ncbi:BspA family leucine-rich repeat surface protein [Companilactobacillus furfuricola]|uniref:BspA family leucine-rich repeat surface protein n=1 Tax=Companilactobacillus furfuricola TaxID=1462575 RepID=UPI000F7679B7|nr:BspA family leucine-rich repeat surface protein [Companilactobacillus furfuricola]
MHMKKSNTNRPNTTINRGKIAAIAGLTLTCGMILSDVAPVMAASDVESVETSNYAASTEVNRPAREGANPQQSNSGAGNNAHSVGDEGNEISDGLTLSNDKKVLTIDASKFNTSTFKQNIINNKETITKIIITGKGSVKGDIESLFAGFTLLTKIEGFQNLNTSEVTKMDNLFDGDTNLTDVDFTKFETANVTSMNSMFKNTAFSFFYLPELNTTNVKEMNNMFEGTKAEVFNLESLNTSNVEKMASMFKNSTFKSYDLSKWDTKKVTDMSNMFEGTNAEDFHLQNLNTSNVENMSSMFKNSAFKSYDLSKWDTKKVTDMSNMFENTTSEKINFGDIDLSKVTNMASMFSGSKIKALDLSGIKNIPNASTQGMLNNAKNIENVRIANGMSFKNMNLSGLYYTINDYQISPSPIEASKITDEPKEVIKDGKNKLISDAKNIPTNIDNLTLEAFGKKEGDNYKLHVNPSSIPSGIKLTDSNQTINAHKNTDKLEPTTGTDQFKLKFTDLEIENIPTNTNNVTATVLINGEPTKEQKVGFTIKNVSDSKYKAKEQKNLTGKIKYDAENNKFVLSDYGTINLEKTPSDNSASGSSSSTPSTPSKTPSTNHKVTDKITNIIHKLTTLFHHRHIKLYNRDFKESTDRSLSAGSDWYSDQTIEHNGKTYYRVSKNEYVAAEDIYSYKDKNVVVTTKSDSDKDLVNSQGKISNRRLAKGTPWKSDRTIEINGKTYYRVSTDEFVSADDVVVH